MQKLLTIKDASKETQGSHHFQGTQKRPKVRIEGKLDMAFEKNAKKVVRDVHKHAFEAW